MPCNMCNMKISFREFVVYQVDFTHKLGEKPYHHQFQPWDHNKACGANIEVLYANCEDQGDLLPCAG